MHESDVQDAADVSYGSTDRRRFTKPPQRRGRRGHPVIDDVPGLAAWLEDQFQQFPRPAFREIERRLKVTEFWSKIKALGANTGRTSINDYWHKWKAQRHQPRISLPASKELENHDSLAYEAEITRLANATILAELHEELATGTGLTQKAVSLIELHGRLQASSARREAERRASGKALMQARNEVINLLKKKPEAARIVLEALDDIEASNGTGRVAQSRAGKDP